MNISTTKKGGAYSAPTSISVLKAECGSVVCVYPVEAGTEFEVQCCTVVITETDKGELDISVVGSILTEE